MFIIEYPYECDLRRIEERVNQKLSNSMSPLFNEYYGFKERLLRSVVL